MHDLNTEQITYTVREPRMAHILAALWFLLPFLFIIGTVLTWHEDDEVGFNRRNIQRLC